MGWGAIAAIGGAQLAGSLYGAYESGRATDRANALSRELALRQEALQREFAQHGIRWRVEDAKAAGIHPLYALNASGANYSPVSTQVFADDSKSNFARDFSNVMGQNLSRAAMTTMTQEERVLANLRMERAQLENELLRSQISNINQPTNPPLPSNSGMPLLTGQGNSYPTAGRVSNGGYVEEVPLRVTHTQPGRIGQDVGAIPDYAFARTSTGLAIVPSKDVKERIEDQIIPETMWAIRNYVRPMWKIAPDPKYYPLPKGYNSWKWNFWKQEFQPSRDFE